MIYNQKLSNQLYSYFLSRLGMHEYRKGWIKGDCPDCNRPGKFGIHIGKAKCNCFVCGYDPHPLKLVMALEDVKTAKEAKEIVGNYKEKEYIAPIVEQMDNIKVELPSEFVNIAFGESKAADLARAYVIGRGFDVEEMALKNWGYCTGGEYFGYLIMPFMVEGKVVYFNARRYFGGGAKYNNPTSTTSGLGKSLVIYNAEALYTYSEVYLMEGLINAETMGKRGISTGGKKVSTYQLSIILKSPIESIILLLDPDAMIESIELALKLSFHKKVKLIKLPDDKDVNDLGKKKVLDIIRENKYLSYSELIRMKHDIQRPELTY